MDMEITKYVQYIYIPYYGHNTDIDGHILPNYVHIWPHYGNIMAINGYIITIYRHIHGHIIHIAILWLRPADDLLVRICVLVGMPWYPLPKSLRTC